LGVGNEIWVSEQVGDRVSRWGADGSFLGQIGGGATGGLDNVRGMGVVGNTVYITNAGAANGAPGAAVVMVSTSGAAMGSFATGTTSPSPFGVLAFQGGLLVTSSSANDDIHRYSLAGAPLGTFHNSTTLNFGQQMAIDAPGRVRSLACVCSFSRGKDAARLTLPVLWMGIRTRLGTRKMRRNAFLNILYSADRLRRSDLPKLAAETSSLIGRDLADSPPILMKQLQACARHHLRPRLGELASILTLVVSAEFDIIARPEYGRDLAAAIPGAEFVLHAGVAHGNLLEQPEWLNERLLNHFGSGEGTGGL
jgi:hypothetical protein